MFLLCSNGHAPIMFNAKKRLTALMLSKLVAFLRDFIPYLPSLNFVDKSTQFASRAISGDSARLVYTRSAPRAGSPFAGSLVSHPPQPALLPSSGLASPLTAPPTLDQAALWVISRPRE